MLPYKWTQGTRSQGCCISTIGKRIRMCYLYSEERGITSN